MEQPIFLAAKRRKKVAKLVRIRTSTSTGIHFILAAQDFLIIGTGRRGGKLMDQKRK